MSACGGAGDDLGFGGEQFGLGDAAVDASEDAIHCRGSRPVKAGIHGGQRNLQVGGFLVVIEADDLHLRGHLITSGAQSGQCADGQLIVQAITPSNGTPESMSRWVTRAPAPMVQS